MIDINGIVKQSSEKPEKQTGWEVFAIDVNTGRPVNDEGLAGFAARLIGRRVYVAVDTKHSAVIKETSARFAIFQTKEDEDVKFRLRVGAKAEDAARVAELLYDAERSPSEILRQVVLGKIKALLEQGARKDPRPLIERLIKDQAQWQKLIADEIKVKTGLTGEIIFQPPKPLVEADISVRLSDITVWPKDAPDHKYPLSLQLVLEPRSGAATSPFPKVEQERHALLTQIIGKAVRAECTLFMYWYQREDVQDLIQSHADEILKDFGYRVKDLRLNPVAPPLPVEEMLTETVDWKGRLERTVSFRVETRVRLSEQGAGVYEAMGRKPNRADWLKDEVSKALDTAMYSRDVLDLTEEVEADLRTQVHAQLTEAAVRIGHEVQTFVATADVPERVWLRKQRVTIEPTEFKTKNDLVPAEFEIDLILQMSRLAQIEQFLTKGRNTNSYDLVRDRIIEIAKSAAERTMSQIEPEAYFNGFEAWDNPIFEDGGAPDTEKTYVRDTLIKSIRSELGSRFELAFCDVTLRRVDTAAQEVFKDVKKLREIAITNLEIDPADAVGADETIKFDLIFSVVGIDPAAMANAITTRANDPEALSIKILSQSVRAWCNEVLHQRTTEQLYAVMGIGSRAAGAAGLRAEVQAEIERLALSHSGIQLSLSSVNRQKSLAEKNRERLAGLQELMLEKDLDTAVTMIEARGAHVADENQHRQFLRDRRDKLGQLINENKMSNEDERTQMNELRREYDDVNRQLNEANARVNNRNPQALIDGSGSPTSEPQSLGHQDVDDGVVPSDPPSGPPSENDKSDKWSDDDLKG